jgi:hypothetical protein
LNIERFVSRHTRFAGQGFIISPMKRRSVLIFLLPVLLLAACGGQQRAEPTVEIAAPREMDASPTATKTAAPLPTETAEPEPEAPTVVPTSVPVEETVQAGETADPAAEPDPTATIEPTIEAELLPETLVVSGQTADGAYFYGNPDAPLTLFDYSDFL